MLGIRRRLKGAIRGRREPSKPAPKQAVAPAPQPSVERPEATSFSAAARAASRGELSPVETSDPAVSPEMVDAGAFWGPVDNESAREKMTGKTLDIDRNECIGCGTCVENTERVFFLNDEECKAYVIAQEGDMELIQDAIDACPVTCISWL